MKRYQVKLLDCFNVVNYVKHHIRQKPEGEEDQAGEVYLKCTLIR